jgi:hypothetical protein
MSFSVPSVALPSTPCSPHEGENIRAAREWRGVELVRCLVPASLALPLKGEGKSKREVWS